MYGMNCSIQCGICHNASQCDHINGSCLNGCGFGFTGGRCTDGIVIIILYFSHFKSNFPLKYPTFVSCLCYMYLECEFGYYGFRCLQECSMFCKRSRDCHHVTGSCNGGCRSGWQGYDCFEGMWFC